MSQNPKIPTHLYPGIIGSTEPPDVFKFHPITSDPASPNPKASK